MRNILFRKAVSLLLMTMLVLSMVAMPAVAAKGNRAGLEALDASVEPAHEAEQTIGSGDGVSWVEYIRYHANYPDGTDATYTVKYTVKSSRSDRNFVYSNAVGVSYADCGFTVPENYQLQKKYWASKADAANGYRDDKAPGFNFTPSNEDKITDLYAIYDKVEPAHEAERTIGSGDGVSWVEYIRYHANYPDGTDATYTVKYTVKSSRSDRNFVYSNAVGVSYADCGFTVPENYQLQKKYWASKADAANGYRDDKAPGFNFTPSNEDKITDLYAIYDKVEKHFAVAEIPAQTYTGAPIKPDVSVTDGEKRLTEGVDYELTYSAEDGAALVDLPVNAGTYFVLVTGKGAYSDTAKRTFVIEPKKTTFVVTTDPTSASYDGQSKTPSVMVADEDRILADGSDYSVAYIFGEETVAKAFENAQFIEAGSYQLIVTGVGNYAGSSGEASFVITQQIPSSYAVIVERAENGTVTADLQNAYAGDIVTVTATPDSGYRLDAVSVKDASGNAVPLTDKGDGVYTFAMPESDATVSARFAEEPPKPVDNPFTDVSDGAYYAEAVRWATAAGITNGVSATTFEPDSICTRAQMVTFLWRYAGSPAPTSTVNPFSDVSEHAYYHDAVLWAVENGITNGTDATSFSPDEPASRAQAVTFLYRMAGSPEASGSSFRDVNANAYYAPAVQWAVTHDITRGTSAETFSPDELCTRAQIATFLYRWNSGK